MIDLLKIVGPKNYARLKAANLIEEKKLRGMTEGQVMSIAGIGPKTAKKLYAALGVQKGEEAVQKTYNHLPMRTRFKHVREAFTKPHETINKLERAREEIYAWQNFLGHVRNIGRPEEEKVKIVPYVPVIEQYGLGRAMTPQTAMEAGYYAEAEIIKEDDGFRINRTIFDTETSTAKVSQTETVGGQEYTPEVQTRIMAAIGESYKYFRERTPTGIFAVILENMPERVIDVLKQKYGREIAANKLIISRSRQDYIEWNALSKYLTNTVINAIIGRFNEYMVYTNYYTLPENSKTTLEDLEKANVGFWALAETQRKPLVSVTQNVQFGMVEAKPETYDFRKRGYKIIPTPKYQKYEFPDNRERYHSFTRMMPLKIESKMVPFEVIQVIDYCLNGEFDIYYLNKQSPVIITSRKHPDIGFIIE